MDHLLKSWFLRILLTLIVTPFLNHALFAQTVSTFSRPGHSMNFNFVGNNWVHISNSTFTYNTRGITTSRTYLHPVTNQNLTKQVFLFDQFDRFAGLTSHVWQNNTWVYDGPNSNVRQLTYNAANQITEDIFQFWANGRMENHRKTNIAYNASGDSVQQIQYFWINNAWVPNSKDSLVYSNGIIQEKFTR